MFLFGHEDKVISAILEALQKYYKEVRPACVSWLGEGHEGLPPDPSPARLAEMIRLCWVHIHPEEESGIASTGLEFDCSWDPEHGFGVRIVKDRILAIGSADESF